MKTNEKLSTPVVTADNNPQKALGGAMKFAVFCVFLGVLITIAGNALIKSLNIFSRDYEEVLAILTYVVGILLIVLGIAFPLAIRSIAQKSTMNVYEDYIEGRGFRVTGSTQTLVNYHETFSKISSVSVIKNNLHVNLSDGSSIRCTAYNAENVAAEIRKRIQ